MFVVSRLKLAFGIHFIEFNSQSVNLEMKSSHIRIKHVHMDEWNGLGESSAPEEKCSCLRIALEIGLCFFLYFYCLSVTKGLEEFLQLFILIFILFTTNWSSFAILISFSNIALMIISDSRMDMESIFGEIKWQGSCTVLNCLGSSTVKFVICSN